MNTKCIIAAVSVATALAVITPAYAGNLGGGLGGGFGGGLAGGMGGMNRLGGVSGQGAFQGQGAIGGWRGKPPMHPGGNGPQARLPTPDISDSAVAQPGRVG